MGLRYSARSRNVPALFTLFFLAGGVGATVVAAPADKAGDHKREQLTKVQTLLVIPPFFGTETLRPPEPSDKKEGKGGAKPPPRPPADAGDPARKRYIEQLRKLEEAARSYFATATEKRTPFKIVSAEALEHALKDLDWTSQKLFQNNGYLRGPRFALPESKAVQQLATKLQADAVLLGTMDEPRAKSGGYFLDPLGVGYESPHVRSRAGYFVMLADGTEVLHEYIEVLRPRTRIGDREYLLIDWREAQEQVMQNFLDEMTRYTPPLPVKPTARKEKAAE